MQVSQVVAELVAPQHLLKNVSGCLEAACINKQGRLKGKTKIKTFHV